MSDETRYPMGSFPSSNLAHTPMPVVVRVWHEAERDYHYSKHFSYQTQAQSLLPVYELHKVSDDYNEAYYSEGERNDEWCLLLGSEALTLVYLAKGQSANVSVYLPTVNSALTLQILNQIQELIPREDLKTNPKLRPFQFWMQTRNGPQAIRRTLEVPLWDEVQENYTADVRSEITRLSSEFRPSHGGQLLLWHGSPGTGKTYAIRFLASAWKDWCTFDYIVDPEEFFGESAYLMSVLLNNEGYNGEDAPVAALTQELQKTRGTLGQWRLLVLEDAGELLAEDARARTGQGLSRLLNLVDGLIGQGLNILVLITTNEPLGKLHPAISRPGRCASSIEFTPLSHEEALAWCNFHDVELPPDRLRSGMSLADLYAHLESFQRVRQPERPPIGLASRR